MTSEQIVSIIEQKDSHIRELTSQLQSSERKIKMLQNQIEQLIRRIYGRKSEKIDPNQLMFDPLIFQALEQPNTITPIVELPKKEPEKKVVTRRNHPGRIPIPEHLERVEIVLDVPEEQKICPETGKPLSYMGDEISEKLEYRPGRLIVNVYKRPKYGSPDSTSNVGVIAAPMPDHPIEKCKADIGLVSHIIVSKFADHLPNYRQDGIFQRERVMIPRATQNSWLMQTYEAVSPLEGVLQYAVCETGILFTDDTPVPLQVKGNGKVKKARIWVYVRGGYGPPLIAYDFSIDRSKKRPLAFLDQYQGYIHADAYSGYDELFRKEHIIEVACWSHARRKFDESVSSRPREATDILSRIAMLYHNVESLCHDMGPEERCRFRQKHASPILEGIFEQLEKLKKETIPSEPLRKALDYTLNQKVALCRYLENGWLRPDNNIAENTLRPVAVGRKNWMFVGSERGGRAAALFFGLIQSCKALDINPWEYFDDMLRRIMSHPVNHLRELLPDQWKPLPKNEHGMIILP